MKTTLKLVAVVAVLFGMSGAANAFVINYVLDARTAGQWTLWANTDAPGGIASAVVDMGTAVNAAATSVAPRSEIAGSAFAGFTLGNIFAAKQAFVGQNTSNAGSLKYGIGQTSIPDATFAPAPFAMAPGSTAVLTVLDLPAADNGKELNGFVKLYNGTGNITSLADGLKAPQPAAFGGVFAVSGSAVVTGPGANLTATYTLLPVPEPGTIVLLGLAVPALALAIRRRKA